MMEVLPMEAMGSFFVSQKEHQLCRPTRQAAMFKYMTVL